MEADVDRFIRCQSIEKPMRQKILRLLAEEQLKQKASSDSAQ
jgi:hypothetical protein